MKPTPSDVEGVIRECYEKFIDGEREHGTLDLDADRRNWIDETIEELEDSVNYLVFQILKLKRLRDV